MLCEVRPESDHLRHPQDPRVMVTDCVSAFDAARDAGFHAAILKRPEAEKHRLSEFVTDITTRFKPEYIEGHEIICLGGNFDELGLFTPVEDIFQQMHTSMFALTGGRLSFYVLPILNLSRTQGDDPEGTGHEHEFHVLNTVVNGSRGTGWISPFGEELAAECGDWMYIGPGFSHFATTDDADVSRMTLVMNH